MTSEETLKQAVAHWTDEAWDHIKSAFKAHVVDHAVPQIKDVTNNSAQGGDSYFWRKLADESINQYNSIPENKDRQRERFIDRYPQENYEVQADRKRYEEELQKVMGYIRNGLDNSENVNDERQREAAEKEKLLGRAVGENEAGKDIVMINGKKYRLKEGSNRQLHSMDTVKELYIRAVATSIMAETDNQSDGAKEILENGGMMLVKNLDERSKTDLLVDMQILALEGDTKVTKFEDRNLKADDLSNLNSNAPKNAKNNEEDLSR